MPVNASKNYTQPKNAKLYLIELKQVVKVESLVNGRLEKHKCLLNNTKPKVAGIEVKGVEQ